ncbi:MAG: hypothetical protein OXB96_02645, partial [Candidatus Kaiserbacteria bacterium]|nr:hypothetical protein [Candidatus Kaiserbacteria bacterium]
VLRNVRLWLDAEDPEVLHTDTSCTSAPANNGDAVRCWEDKSIYASHVRAVDGDCVAAQSGVQLCAYPTLEVDHFGDIDVLRFEAYYRAVLRHDLEANNQDWTGDNFTYFTVFEQVGTPNSYWSFFSNGEVVGADFTSHFQIDAIDVGGGEFHFRTYGLGPDLLFEEVHNTLNLYSFLATPTDLTLFSDGEIVSAGSFDTPIGRHFSQYRINQNRSGHSPNNSRIAEIVIYDDALTHCEIAEVDQYFGLKYHRPFGGGIPGGVRCEEVHVWFDGSRGVTHDTNGVSKWLDEGHNRADATQVTNDLKPDYVADAFNEHAVLHFDGSDVLAFPSDHMPAGTAPRSYFIVARPSGESGRAVLSHGDTDTLGANVTLDITQTEVSVDVDDHIYGITRPAETDVELVTFQLQEGGRSDQWEIRVNGEEQTEATISGSPHSVNTSGTEALIGAKVGAANSDQYDGEVAEIFVYDQVFDDIRLNRIETYFALRYGITLDASSDYVDSHDGVLFDSDGVDSGYTSHIAGIADDEAEHLLQPRSGSEMMGAILTVEVSDRATLEDGEFLLWGHDGGTLTPSTTDTPSSVDQRIGRVWKFRETGGEVGHVTLEFDLSTVSLAGTQVSDFVLIRDTDTTFSTGATVLPATSYVNKIVTFSHVAIDDAEYLTVGTVTSVTDPSTTLSASIFDTSDNVVDDPLVHFSSPARSGNTMTTAGTFGTLSEKIMVQNGTTVSAWNLTLAAENTQALWRKDASHLFDFNDGSSDGSDNDSVAGTLIIDPSSAVISASSGCDSDGLIRGSSASFVEGSVDAITLISANSSADTGCSWSITGIDLSQEIPAGQQDGSYSINMVLTVTAQ